MFSKSGNLSVIFEKISGNLSRFIHVGKFCCDNFYLRMSTVVDPGFPRRGRGYQRQRWERKSIIWQNFSRKLDENDRIWTQKWGVSLAPSQIRQWISILLFAYFSKGLIFFFSLASLGIHSHLILSQQQRNLSGYYCVCVCMH